MQLILASQSPRRRQLLGLITQNFAVLPANIEETPPAGLPPVQIAQQFALEKAQAVFLQAGQNVVIGADTVVEIDGQLLGKPQSQEHARQMLCMLSGRRHFVHTGVCIFAPEMQGAARCLFAKSTQVSFVQISPQEIERYVASQEPFDKAGGYGVQGGAAKFVSQIKGCYFNVMGLPVAALYAALKEICPQLIQGGG